MDILLTPGLDLAMRSVGIYDQKDLDDMDFWGEADGQQITPSSRFTSDTKLKGLDETQSDITSER